MENILLRLNNKEAGLIKRFAKRKNQTVHDVIKKTMLEVMEDQEDLMELKDAIEANKDYPTYTQDDMTRRFG